MDPTSSLKLDLDKILKILSDFKEGRFSQIEGVSSDPAFKLIAEKLNELSQSLEKQKQTVSELRLLEEKYRLIAETMTEAFVLQDSDAKIIQFNQMAPALLGLTEDQLLGRTSMDPRWKAIREDGSDFPGTEHPSVIALKTGQKISGKVMGLRLPSGDLRWVCINATPYHMAGPLTAQSNQNSLHVLCTFSDVTAIIETRLQKSKVEMEFQDELGKALIRSMANERSFRAIFDNSPFGMIKLDSNLRIQTANATFLSLTGYSEEELTRLTILDLTHPEDRDSTLNIRDGASKQGHDIVYFEKRYLHKSGSFFWVRVSSRAVQLEDFGERHWFAIVEDITQLRELEKTLEAERLKAIHNAKLASLGEMSAGVAHEINNPLAIISGTVSLLQNNQDNPEKFLSRLSIIKNSVTRISKIVLGLKKFSRTTGKQAHECVSLAHIVTESLILTEAKAKSHSTEMRVSLQSDAIILCDEVEIEQVLVNLINNAVYAVQPLSEKWVQIAIFDDKNQVVLQVRDSGHGISQAIQQKVFEPFFTTKPVGEGTGIGLSITKGILEQHSATIEIKQGDPHTCFEIRFPIQARGIKDAA